MDEWKVHTDPWNGKVVLENLRKEFLMIGIVKLYDKRNNKSWIYECRNNRVQRTELPEYLRRLARKSR